MVVSLCRVYNAIVISKGGRRPNCFAQHMADLVAIRPQQIGEFAVERLATVERQRAGLVDELAALLSGDCIEEERQRTVSAPRNDHPGLIVLLSPPAAVACDDDFAGWIVGEFSCARHGDLLKSKRDRRTGFSNVSIRRRRQATCRPTTARSSRLARLPGHRAGQFTKQKHDFPKAMKSAKDHDKVALFSKRAVSVG
jgi:hypothetical protein